MKLSIIVPVYNLENYIATTLDSLLSIHFDEDYEILVMNDGSTDRSEEIIHQYQQGHRNIHLFTIENRGVSNARNVGLQKATGEYITFFDGDDTVDPDFFAKSIQELDNGGYDFVQGNYLIVDNDRSRKQQYVEKDMVLSNRTDMFRCFLGKSKIIHNSVWGKVYRSEIAKKVSFDIDLAVAEDQKYVFDVLLQAHKIKLLAHHGINYIQRNTSVAHTFSVEKEKNKLAVLSYFESNISQPEILMSIDVHRIESLQDLYWYYTKVGDPQADEIRKELLGLYSRKLLSSLDIKTRIKLDMLRYARFALDFYICKIGR